MSEIKDIPKHWEIKKLGEVCDKLSLNKIKIKQKDYLQQGTYPVIDQGQDLIGGYYDDVNFVVPNEPPYIIFGDHTKVKKYIPFKFVAGADGVKVLKSKSNTDPKFLYYAIHSIKIEDKGYARHFQLLEKSDFPLPPLLTAQQQLKVYRQSLLKWAFEGKLTNKNLKEGELPKGWKWVKLSDLGSWKGGGTPSKQVNKYWENGYNLWVTSKDMKIGVINNSINKITDEAILNSSANKIPKGAILFVMRSGILRHTFPVAIAGKELTVNQDLQTLSPNGLATSEFIYWFIRAFNNEIRQKCSKDGTTVESIESNSLKNYPFILPPLKDQQQIVEELESKLTVCDKIEETISQSLQQAETLRQSILKKAFEGKLI